MNLKNVVEYINKLTSKKNAYNLVIVFLIGVLLLLVTSFFKDSPAAVATVAENQPQEETQSIDTSLTDYENIKKAELKDILSKVKGIGRVDVMISFESGEELVTAVNTNTGVSVTEEKDNEGGARKNTQNNSGETVVMQTEGNDNTPVVLKKLSPKVSGVIIVAEGAEDTKVKADIVSAVSGVFGIPNYKIKVFPMK